MTELTVQKTEFSNLYPTTTIDKPIRLSKLEMRWIRSFNLHLLDFVRLYPQRFKNSSQNQMFETYRRMLFVFWMNTLATRQLQFEKEHLENILELKRLARRRRELTEIALSDGWDPRAYD